jgi:TolB-like protein
MDPKKFFSELKRRKVYGAAISYGITGWLLAQIASLITSSFEAPSWVIKVIIIALIIGYPIVLILAWVYEMSPQGMRKTKAKETDDIVPILSKKTIIRNWIISLIVSIFFVSIGSWWALNEYNTADKRAIKSLAILPFGNFTGNHDQDYLAEGLHFNLITAVSQVGSLRIIGQKSTLKYKNSEKSVPEIANELGVEAIIESSIMKFGDTVQLNIQMIQAFPEERNIWRQVFERPTNEIYSLYNEVSQQIAKEIDVILSTQEKSLLSTARKVDPDAYQAYLRGRFYWDKLTREDLDQSLKYYQLATELDSTFAPAYAGIAAVWSGRRQMGMVTPKEANKLEAIAIDKAFALDSTDVEVLYNYVISSGWIAWDWKKLEETYHKVLQLNPGHANAHAYYSNFLIAMGKDKEAMFHIEKALQLDPYNSVIEGLYFINLSFLERCDEVILLSGKTENPLSKQALINCYDLERMYEKAYEQQLAFFSSIKDTIMKETIKKGYQEGGYFEAIRKQVSLMEKRADSSNSYNFTIPLKYALLEDKEKTLIWLEKGFIAHDAQMPYIASIPFFNFLQDEPKFKAILKKMNLRQKYK